MHCLYQEYIVKLHSAWSLPTLVITEAAMRWYLPSHQYIWQSRVAHYHMPWALKTVIIRLCLSPIYSNIWQEETMMMWRTWKRSWQHTRVRLSCAGWLPCSVTPVLCEVLSMWVMRESCVLLAFTEQFMDFDEDNSGDIGKCACLYSVNKCRLQSKTIDDIKSCSCMADW